MSILNCYPNQLERNKLLEGIQWFPSSMYRIKDHRPTLDVFLANEHVNETLAKLNKEVEIGRMLGSFVELPISTLQISPKGLVPKTNGYWSLITKLSSSHDYNIGSFFKKKYWKVTYTSFDSILEKKIIL